MPTEPRTVVALESHDYRSVAGPAGGIVPAVTIPRRIDVAAAFEKNPAGRKPIGASKDLLRVSLLPLFFPSSTPKQSPVVKKHLVNQKIVHIFAPTRKDLRNMKS